jgi:hypothetical protein
MTSSPPTGASKNTRIFIVIAVVVVLVAGGVAIAIARSNGRSSPDAPPQTRVAPGGNIGRYLSLHGDQVVVVPNGTYTASDVTNAHHDATSGRLKGWLVLKAQSPHGVIIDMSSEPLHLEKTASRILFVGFKFVNGPLYDDGTDIAFWYTDHSFSAYEWKAVQHKKYLFPHTLELYADTTLRAALYGSDVHDTGHALDLSNSTDTRIEGVHVYNIDDMGQDPNGTIHLDAIDAVSGRMNGLTVTQSWLQGFAIFEDSNGSRHRTAGGPCNDLTLENSWFSDSPAAGIQFVSNKGNDPRGIFGTMTDLHVWNMINGNYRFDIVDFTKHHVPNTRPARINLVEKAVVRSAPPKGAISPAAQWRLDHPYDGWMYAIH